MTPILLDTTYLYEMSYGRDFFSPELIAVFGMSDRTLIYSAVSIWEMRIKHDRRHPSGDRKSEVRPSVVRKALPLLGVTTCLDVTADHAEASLDVPLRHKDPFDEQLLIQAQVEGLRFLTRDRHLTDHPLAFRP